MQLKSDALSKLVGRLKLATDPASRCFLVALFISGFSSSYFGEPPSKTRPENSANPDVENHSPKPTFALVRTVLPMDRTETMCCAPKGHTDCLRNQSPY
jgi:hypothetical protein